MLIRLKVHGQIDKDLLISKQYNCIFKRPKQATGDDRHIKGFLLKCLE